jgi:hypothetical protein
MTTTSNAPVTAQTDHVRSSPNAFVDAMCTASLAVLTTIYAVCSSRRQPSWSSRSVYRWCSDGKVTDERFDAAPACPRHRDIPAQRPVPRQASAAAWISLSIMPVLPSGPARPSSCSI